MWHVFETREDWWGEPREIDYLEGLRRWEDNIKLDLQEMGLGGMDLST